MFRDFSRKFSSLFLVSLAPIAIKLSPIPYSFLPVALDTKFSRGGVRKGEADRSYEERVKLYDKIPINCRCTYNMMNVYLHEKDASHIIAHGREIVPKSKGENPLNLSDNILWEHRSINRRRGGRNMDADEIAQIYSVDHIANEECGNSYRNTTVLTSAILTFILSITNVHPGRVIFGLLSAMVLFYTHLVFTYDILANALVYDWGRWFLSGIVGIGLTRLMPFEYAGGKLYYDQILLFDKKLLKSTIHKVIRSRARRMIR